MLKEKIGKSEVDRRTFDIASRAKYHLEKAQAQIAGKYLKQKHQTIKDLVIFDKEEELFYVKSRFISRYHMPIYQRYQLFLVGQSAYAQSVMVQFHRRNHMLSNSLVNSKFEEVYFCPYSLRYFEQLSKTCQFCIKIRKLRSQVKMGPLPYARLSRDDPPFSFLSMDIAGPIILQEVSDNPKFVHNKRHKKTGLYKKYYILVAVCYSTQAIALYGVDSLDTSSMVLALQSHFSMRGRPFEISSDLQKSFISTYRLLKESEEEGNVDEEGLSRKGVAAQQELDSWLGFHNIRFLNPASHAPHLQGLSERKVQVVKQGLQGFKHKTQTPVSFQHHLNMVSEFYNSIPIYIDGNDFVSRQQLLTGYKHRPGSVEIKSDSPLVAQFRRQSLERMKFFDYLHCKYINKRLLDRKWAETKGHVFEAGDVVYLRDRDKHNSLHFGLAIVDQIRHSDDHERRFCLVKYKRYFDTHYRYTWRHANTLVLVLAHKDKEKNRTIPDLFGGLPEQLEGDENDVQPEDDPFGETEPVPAETDRDAENHEEQSSRPGTPVGESDEEDGIPDWSTLARRYAGELEATDRFLDLDLPEEDSDTDSDPDTPAVLGFQDGQWVELDQPDEAPAPRVHSSSIYVIPDQQDRALPHRARQLSQQQPGVRGAAFRPGPRLPPARATPPTGRIYVSQPAGRISGIMPRANRNNHGNQPIRNTATGTVPRQNKKKQPGPHASRHIPRQKKKQPAPHISKPLPSHGGRPGNGQGLHLPPYWAKTHSGDVHIHMGNPDAADSIYPTRKCRNRDWWRVGILPTLVILLIMLGRAMATDDMCVDRWSYDFDEVETQHQLFQQWKEEMKDCDTGPHLLYGLTPLVINRRKPSETTYAELFQQCRNGGFQIPFFPASSLAELYGWLRAQNIPDTEEESGVAAPVYVVSSEIRWLRNRAKTWFSDTLIATIDEAKRTTLKQVSIQPFPPGSQFSADVNALNGTLPTGNKTRMVICFPRGLRMQRTFGAWNIMLSLFHTNNCFRHEDKLFKELHDLIRNQSGAGKPCQGRQAKLLETDLTFFKTRPDAANSHWLPGVPQELDRLEVNFLALEGQLTRAVRLVKEHNNTTSARTFERNSKQFWENLKEGSPLEVTMAVASMIGSSVVIACFCCVIRCCTTTVWPTLARMLGWLVRPVRQGLQALETTPAGTERSSFLPRNARNPVNSTTFPENSRVLTVRLVREPHGNRVRIIPETRF